MGSSPAGDAAEVEKGLHVLSAGEARVAQKFTGNVFANGGVLHRDAFLGTSDSFANSFSSSWLVSELRLIEFGSRDHSSEV